MKAKKAIGLVLGATTLAVAALLLLTVPAFAQGPPVIFPEGPWPWYAQGEISVHREPPIAGQPTEICTEIVSLDLVSTHPVTIEFGVANFGIGVPFVPVGRTEVEVPPGGRARGCVVWVPREPGHWCIQAILKVAGHPDQISQRNLDVWEPLHIGQPHAKVVPVGPLPTAGNVTFTVESHLPDWQVELEPSSFFLPAQTVQPVTLTVTPTLLVQKLGTRRPVVDVEGFLDGKTIGGFRKLDSPPVPLHRFKDPFYAESEISVHPYPPRAGEPTEICVELRNLSDITRTVEVQFEWANFGIGLPFQPIDGPIVVEIPPHGKVKVCTTWVPPFGGQFCVQVWLRLPGSEYREQFSQRNLDVIEVFEPNKPTTLVFPVGNFEHPFLNPVPGLATIHVTMTKHLHNWNVELNPEVLPNVPPGTMDWVTMTVTPPYTWSLFPQEDWMPIVDVEAYIGDPDWRIGGFRKIFRPPVPIHRPEEPPYGESEISIDPYPPRAGEPTDICTRIRNNTDFTQTVEVYFDVANFGIGIPFVPIAPPMSVELPPHSEKEVCVTYIFSYGGQFCVQVRIRAGDNYPEVFSQRNIDVAEILLPGQPDEFEIPVGNPFPHPVTITLGLINHTGWEVSLSPEVIPNAQPWPTPPTPVTLWITPSLDVVDLEDSAPVIDLEAYVDDERIGGVRKVFRPPIPIHRPGDPIYAEREITIDPYPPRAGEPTQICVELRNPTAITQTVTAQFLWAQFGIGLPFQPINGPRVVTIPPHGMVRECITWIPPFGGRVCIKVELTVPGYNRVLWSQRNIDVGEPLEPGAPHSLPFPVGNPTAGTVTVTLGLIRHLPDWDITLDPTNILPAMLPGEERLITLTVIPPPNRPLPDDGAVIVDVEGHAAGELIGGFRKIHRPPVPIHRPGDPIYAESEITIHPYPPRAREPTELGVEVRNTIGHDQVVTVTFSYANFGIGLPFTDINGPLTVTVPAHGAALKTIVWLPPRGGLWCIRVKLESPDYPHPFYSQRNIDVGEPLRPGVSHSRPFRVGNDTGQPVTITLGLIRHVPDWHISLEPASILPAMQPGEQRVVTLTVRPPPDRPLPEDGAVIVDVEGHAAGELIGGFRKIHRPPVPIHRPRDPIYAESEIGVHPYPAIGGAPTDLSVEVQNPTPDPQIVTATFKVSHFGIGLPFTTTNITPNPIRIFVPPHGMARGHVVWMPPPVFGHKLFCVQVDLEMPDGTVVWSRRNIDVGEPLEPGVSHPHPFPVANPAPGAPVTITLGLINHRSEWDVSVAPSVLPDVGSTPVTATLWVTPSADARLGDDRPVVDVEAYVDGELIGGFRKIDRPPIPIHRPHERVYAETELSVTPDPPVKDHPAQVCTEVQNISPVTQSVIAEFGWAKFGFGIPFTTSGMLPPTRTLTVSPHITATGCVTWTPTMAGSQCLIVELRDPLGDYPEQRSQRNVRVLERPPCGETRVYTFTVYNDSPFPATVEIGISSFDVPANWIVTTQPSQTLELGPYSEGVVTVTVEIPCPLTLQAMQAMQEVYALQEEAGSTPTIDVEGYIDGELVGGIELQFAAGEQSYIYLPVILKQYGQ